MKLLHNSILSEVEGVGNRHQSETGALDTCAQNTVADGSECESACAVAGQTVRHLHTYVLERYRLRSIYVPLLVYGDEVFSEFFVYVYT